MNSQSAPFRLRRLSVEKLDGRDLCAGNVTAVVSGGNLTVTGDAAANGLYIRYLGGTSYELASRTTGISGDRGTLINGTSKVRVQGVTGDLRVELGAGDDTLELTSNVRVTAPHLRNIAVNMGTGNRENVLAAQVWASGDVSFNAGSGDAIVQIGLAGGVQVGGSMTVTTGNKHDSLEIAGSTVGRDLTVNSGAGDDRVTLTNAPGGPIKVGNMLRINAGQGNDRVTVTGVNAASIDILLGDGVDQLFISNSQIRDGRADGGGGNDELRLGSGNRFDNIQFSGFETGDIFIPTPTKTKKATFAGNV